jgi:hypothetical protein
MLWVGPRKSETGIKQSNMIQNFGKQYVERDLRVAIDFSVHWDPSDFADGGTSSENENASDVVVTAAWAN